MQPESAEGGAWYAAYRAGRADHEEPQICEFCSAGKPLGTQKLGVDPQQVNH